MFKPDGDYNAAVKGFIAAAVGFVLVACAWLCGLGGGWWLGR